LSIGGRSQNAATAAKPCSLAVILLMTTLEVYNKTKSLFAELEKCENLESLQGFLQASNLEQEVKAFYEKYPAFDFTLTPNDINALRNAGVITEINTLNPDKFPKDSLSKLLAAVLWKNGDIKKVQHLIDGIVGAQDDRSEYSLVFKQYGASLASSAEPIVDQHVLRAFEIYCLETYLEAAVEKSRNKSLFKTKDRPLLNKYRAWFTQLLSTVPLSERSRYGEVIDKVIFIHGKAVKN
jgi:hypothetical protein